MNRIFSLSLTIVLAFCTFWVVKIGTFILNISITSGLLIKEHYIEMNINLIQVQAIYVLFFILAFIIIVYIVLAIVISLLIIRALCFDDIRWNKYNPLLWNWKTFLIIIFPGLISAVLLPLFIVESILNVAIIILESLQTKLY